MNIIYIKKNFFYFYKLGLPDNKMLSYIWISDKLLVSEI